MSVGTNFEYPPEDIETMGISFMECPGFRFCGGMLLVPQRHVRHRESPWRPDGDFPWEPRSVFWPDFRDAATWGCLLGLFREIYPGAWVRAIRLRRQHVYRYVVSYPSASTRFGPRALAETEPLALLTAWEHEWTSELFDSMRAENLREESLKR